jgi:predicted MFS family arabinose efflux permease
MENRWIILAVLFFVRTVLGLQFQSVASVSPFLIDVLDIDYTRLGMLIGLYQLPGIVLAFPGGLLGKRFGDKRVVITALVLMAIGGLIMGLNDSYALTIGGRLLSGMGGIFLNVLLTKMVADWFAGKEIITAMAILMSSWPFGISLGLVSLGPLAAVSSWQLVMYLTAGACLFALVLVATVYRPPPVAKGQREGESTRLELSQQEMWLVILAGLIWTLFNVGFIALPSFAPAFLTSIGYTVTYAASLVSLVTWIVIPAVQLGGFVSERLRRPNVILAICFLGVTVVMWMLPYWPYPLVSFILLGLLFGPPTGIIVALPMEVLHPENRAAGMGIFYTSAYGGVTALTTLAGFSRDLTQRAAAPILFGGILLIIAVIILVIFRTLQARLNRMPSEGNQI